MGIEDMYERNFRSRNSFSGYDKNDKPSKVRLKPTKFKVGDKIVVKGEDGVIYLRGKIVSLLENMAIEGTIIKYSNHIRYPVGTKDLFIMGRNGKRNLNGEDFTVYKVGKLFKQKKG